MSRTPTLRRSIGRLSSSVTRAGRRSLVLGALLLAASAVTVLATANTRPTITSATLSRSVVNEGDTITLSLSFTDPDIADYHNVRIRWGDDLRTEQVNVPFGQTSIQVNHTYLDDNQSGTYSKIVRPMLYDRQSPPGSNPNDNLGDGSPPHPTKELPVQVRNVAPSFVARGISVTRESDTQVVIEGDVVDPGAADQIQVTAMWGEQAPRGSAMPCSIGRDGRHFVCEHTYRASAQPMTYPIRLTVKDDDGGIGQYQTTVRLP